MIRAIELRRREGIGALAVVLAYGIAVAAALANRAGSGPVTGTVEAASSVSAGLLGGVANTLPLGYAFGAGMVAAVNPCGFALLPGYMSFYLGSGDEPAASLGYRQRLLRGIQVSVMVTLSFVLAFGVAGLAISAAAAPLSRVLPWAGLAIGILLVLVGGLLLGGATLSTSFGGRLADTLGTHARRASSAGYLSYGLAYGTASLSCTLPIFLTVVGGALTARGVLSAAGAFVLYGLGMGAVLTAVTIGTAFFKYGAVTRVRRASRHLHGVSAVLVLLAGAYIIYYWLTLGGLMAGVR